MSDLARGSAIQRPLRAGRLEPEPWSQPSGRRPRAEVPREPLRPYCSTGIMLSMARPRIRRGPRPALGRRLIEARARRGLSQAAAAAECGVSLNAWAHYETGSRRPSALARLALEAWSAPSLRELHELFPHVPNESR